MRNLQKWRGASHQLGLTCLFGLSSLLSSNIQAQGQQHQSEQAKRYQMVEESYKEACFNKDRKVLATFLVDGASFCDPTVQTISLESVGMTNVRDT